MGTVYRQPGKELHAGGKCLIPGCSFPWIRTGRISQFFCIPKFYHGKIDGEMCLINRDAIVALRLSVYFSFQGPRCRWWMWGVQSRLYPRWGYMQGYMGNFCEFTCSHLSRNLSCDVCDVSCHVIQRSIRLTHEPLRAD